MRYLTFLIILFSPLIANSTEGRARTINVSGKAEIQVEPDRVIFSMAVLNKNDTLNEARKDNDKTVTDFLAYLTKALNIPAKHIQTEHLTVEPTYFSCGRRDEQAGTCDTTKVQYYTLNRGIQIKLDDLTKYDKVVAQSFEFGVNQINGIQFVTLEPRKQKDKAREMATKAAQEKAHAITRTLGMSVGKPISVRINDRDFSYGANASINAVSSHSNIGGSSLSLGQISISASVDITFEML